MNGQDRRQVIDPSALARAADCAALAIDQADADRGTAAADQASSDVDAAASERDDADAIRDQRSADRDQASADALYGTGTDTPPGDALVETYRATREERSATRVRRLKTHTSRAGSAQARLGTSRNRDRNAARRDDKADWRDRQAVELEGRLTASDRPIREQFERLRERAASDRASAAADRRAAATERTEASIELGRVQSELYGTHLDDLTGTFGRALGQHVLDLEIDRSRRDGGRLVLACIDVDGLNGINDRAGHVAGDLVLRALVGAMRASLRPFDPIVRYGGDEFVCTVAGVGTDEVDERFDAIRRSLYADTGASFSLGLASLVQGETLDQLVARADVALLDAKRIRPA